MPNQVRVLKFGAVFCVVLLGAWLRLHHLEFQSLWLDEIFTWESVSQKSWTSFFYSYIYLELSPPLYFLLQFLWNHWYEPTEWGLRITSVVYGTAFVFSTFLLGRRVGGFRLGFIASLLAAVSQPAVVYAQEARAYALLMLLVNLSLFVWLDFRDRPRDRRAWWVFFTVTFLLTQTHVYGALFVFFLALLTFFYLRSDRKSLLQSVVGFIGLGLLMLPWLLHDATRDRLVITFRGAPDVFELWRSLMWLVGWTEWAVTLALILIVVACASDKKSRARDFMLLVVGPALLGFTIAQWNFAYQDRYLTYALGPLFVLISMGIDWFWRYRAFAGLAITIVLTSMYLHFTYVDSRIYSAPIKMQLREATLAAFELLDANAGSKLFVMSQGPDVFKYYRLKFRPEVPVTGHLSATSFPAVDEWPEAFTEPPKIVVLSALSTEDLSAVPGLQEKYNILETRDFPRLMVFLLQKKSP